MMHHYKYVHVGVELIIICALPPTNLTSYIFVAKLLFLEIHLILFYILGSCQLD